MQRYILKRTLSMFVTLALISVAIFVMVRLLPGNIIDVLFMGDTTATPAEKHDALVQLGMNGSWWSQYWHWIGRIFLHGDFGRSYRSQQPISQILGHAVHITGELIFLAIIIAVAVGLPLGALSAVRRDRVEDYAARSVGLVGISIPNFFLATIFLIILSRIFHWIPPLSYVPFTQNPVQNLEQFIFPAITISVFTMAVTMRLLRATMLEVLGLDYVRTARAKGVPRRVVIRKHALRNALIPVATVVAYEIGSLIGAAAVVETIFNLPGLGYILLQSLSFRDYPIIQSTVLLIAVVFLVFNLLVDILYGVLDPRIVVE
ncbi:MAG TPA: ABC transporter permease [Gaiellaceae bacterium]|nr:ABC transporter permease [Gaiellaceae bacterium]